MDYILCQAYGPLINVNNGSLLLYLLNTTYILSNFFI